MSTFLSIAVGARRRGIFPCASGGFFLYCRHKTLKLKPNKCSLTRSESKQNERSNDTLFTFTNSSGFILSRREIPKKKGLKINWERSKCSFHGYECKKRKFSNSLRRRREHIHSRVTRNSGQIAFHQARLLHVSISFCNFL